MKKISMIAAVAAAALMGSCNKAPQANLKSDIDTLSYAIGLANTQGLKEYLVQRMDMDTTYIDDFIKGLNEAANAGDDKRKAAYYAGLQIGQQVSQQMIKGINSELFGEDSTATISKANFIAGFIDGTLDSKTAKMNIQQAQEYAQSKMEAVKKAHNEKTYGPNREESEKFMKSIAKKAGVKALANGVYYEVIKEGKGAVPADSSRVKVNYEGKLVNDSVFDSSYKRGEPATFAANQVIPGWTEALTHMPVGSTWMVYIPWEQAYGEREAGMIKPYSALKFKIELISIEK